MKPVPAPSVVDWLNNTSSGTLFFTTISVGEIEFGIQRLPPGARRTALAATFDAFLRRAFAGRVLPFDFEATRHYGALMSTRRALGAPMSIADAQIAATAKANGFAIATRNVAGFCDCGLDIVDPFL
ncbi:MAG: PIN domain-containing protein [Gammaproteobacteria bacterium]|nr:PIN domain-containing protein [Gammaproteobacteria bacterium]